MNRCFLSATFRFEMNVYLMCREPWCHADLLSNSAVNKTWGSSKKEEYAIRMLIQTNIERLMIDEYTQ